MKRPVFIVGCPRSGTTLLYSMLLAAGGFAVYRKETYFYDLLPRFPSFRTARARRRFADQFLRGYLGKVPGLNVAPVVAEVVDRCRSSADFLPELLARLTAQQQMERWMEATPTHVLCMAEIRRQLADALFLHVIRDGRDCALSLEQQRWIHTLPWDRSLSLGVAVLYWEWMVRSGRAFGRNDVAYKEVRFEDLVSRPAATLDEIGRFIDHDLDYDRITRHRLHSLKRPNTSYAEERDRPDFNPLERWKDKCGTRQLRLCESVAGTCLEELGYHREIEHFTAGERARATALRTLYLNYFALRQIVKRRTPLGRFFTDTSVWAEQPSPAEKPFLPAPPSAAARAGIAVEFLAGR